MPKEICYATTGRSSAQQSTKRSSHKFLFAQNVAVSIVLYVNYWKCRS